MRKHLLGPGTHDTPLKKKKKTQERERETLQPPPVEVLSLTSGSMCVCVNTKVNMMVEQINQKTESTSSYVGWDGVSKVEGTREAQNRGWLFAYKPVCEICLSPWWHLILFPLLQYRLLSPSSRYVFVLFKTKGNKAINCVSCRRYRHSVSVLLLELP